MKTNEKWYVLYLLDLSRPGVNLIKLLGAHLGA